MSGANTPDHDVVVIGGGLAGLTAGLFAARYGHSTLVLEATVPGGHLVNVEKIEDFPGHLDGIPGYDLCPTVQEQAETHGAQFQLAEVEALEPDGRDWRVVTGEGSHRAKTVIVASGSRPKALGVPGESQLQGRGISHCATCDGPFFANRVVGVAGGGDHALQEALTLSGFASRVIILSEAPAFLGQATYQRRVAERPQIEARHGVAVTEVLGNGALSAVRLHDLTTAADTHLELAGLFVYVGLEPNTAFLRGRLPLAPDGRIPTDPWMRTDLPGVFAAGDVRQDAAGHAITSAGDGATAAVAAHRYLVARADSE